MSLIKMPYEVSSEFYLKGLIYGQPGIGKSTTAVSMPNPVLIDCDNGAYRIQAAYRPPFLPVTCYEEVLEVIDKEVAKYETVEVDTAGKLLDYMGAYIIKNNPKMGRKDGGLTLQGYGVRKHEFIRLLKKVSIMGKHLVFVAHEIEERRGDESVIRPEVGGSSGADLIKELDLVGYMEAMGRKRTISFTPCDRYYAKNSARLPDMMEVPELANGRANDFLASIVTKYRAVLTEECTQAKVYNELIAKMTKAIKAIKTVETANKIFQRLGETEHIWDSKHRAWAMLQKRAAELNLTFNTEAKKYEQNQPDAA